MHFEGTFDPDGTLNPDSTGPSLVDRNIYLNSAASPQWWVYMASDGQTSPPGAEYSSFASYRTALQATRWPSTGGGTTRCAAWEANSSFSNSQPVFDWNTANALLNAGDYDTVIGYFRNYVKSIQWTLNTSGGPRIAAIYYLATNGSDSNNGSLAAPFGTFHYAHNHLSPGDTLYIRGGTYIQPWWDFDFTAAGTAGARILVSAYQGETVIFDNCIAVSWTWDGSAFGGSWKTYLPGLSPYTGGFTTRFFAPVNDFLCSETTSSSDFANPPSPYLSGGYLVVSIIWVDPSGWVYFKSAQPGGVVKFTDPSTQVEWSGFLHGDGDFTAQFSAVDANYVTFRGITFMNTGSLHQQSLLGGTISQNIENCNFKAMGQGIAGGGTGNVITGCWFDHIGQLVSSSSQGEWSIYITSTDTLISDNLATRGTGGAIKLLYSQSTTAVNNCEYDNISHTLIVPVSGLVYQNNININRPGATYSEQMAGSPGCLFDNNYVEGRSMLTTGFSNSGEVLANFSATKNLFNLITVHVTETSAFGLVGYVTPASTNIDYNVYMGIGMQQGQYALNNLFYVYGAPVGGTTALTQGYTLAGWQSLLLSTFGRPWEANSVVKSNTTTFDCATCDALIAAGDAAAVKAYMRNYVRSIQQTLGTTAGPSNLAAPLLASYNAVLRASTNGRRTVGVSV